MQDTLIETHLGSQSTREFNTIDMFRAKSKRFRDVNGSSRFVFVLQVAEGFNIGTINFERRISRKHDVLHA